MLRRPRAAMAEEGSSCPWLRLPWASALRPLLPLALIVAAVYGFLYSPWLAKQQQPQQQPEAPSEKSLGSSEFYAQAVWKAGERRGVGEAQKTDPPPLPGWHFLSSFIFVLFFSSLRTHTQWDIAELQLNRTAGARQDPRLRWQAGPALGRSFLFGPELDDGQLRIQRDGIYRLHIQVTLANCSWIGPTRPRGATLALSICKPVTHSISLLRLHFSQSCSVVSQRLTPLARGDLLCTNLTLPLVPSQNPDETFFGVQWVHP
ncbi:CD70 antigen-like [Ochotona princeps]|uniref:CD70 antigen-like n=1 Tax=Ochotona princeps TaxID=9978 RepID=UPI0027153856|nr:CD70 antigen-like [Ochotona princeps]